MPTILLSSEPALLIFIYVVVFIPFAGSLCNVVSEIHMYIQFFHLFINLFFIAGIVSYMKKISGPASKEYTVLEKLQKRLADAEDNVIVG